jgi:hypothetical protein
MIRLHIISMKKAALIAYDVLRSYPISSTQIVPLMNVEVGLLSSALRQAETSKAQSPSLLET